MPFPPPEARHRLLLGAGLAAAFAISAAADPRVLGAAALATAALFHRGLPGNLRRVLRSVAPLALVLAAASWGWLSLLRGRPAPLEPFAALVLRTSLIAFLTLSVLARVDLFRALAPWPAATRLLVLTLAQIHALRLLATESLLGLRSRLLRRPGTAEVVRGAGGITGALFALSARSAREVSDALRSRGFR